MAGAAVPDGAFRRRQHLGGHDHDYRTGRQAGVLPNPANVQPGQLVVFKNNDVTQHHVILDDGTVQTPDINPGATSAPVAMGTSGSLTYHCTDSPGHGGRLQRRHGEPPPNCNQAYCD